MDSFLRMNGSAREIFKKPGEWRSENVLLAFVSHVKVLEPYAILHAHVLDARVWRFKIVETRCPKHRLRRSTDQINLHCQNCNI